MIRLADDSSRRQVQTVGWLRVLERTLGRGGVVAYHGVGEAPTLPVMHTSPARLREQLDFLRLHYEVVPLREQVARWAAGRSTAGTVSITFDDAYAGVARHAVPLLAEMDLPATIFVSSAFAAVSGGFWWDALERDRRGAGTGPWSRLPSVVGLPALDPLDADTSRLVRDRVLSSCQGRWPVPLPADAADDWRSMGWGELAVVAEDARVDFGCHTVSHPALPALPRVEQEREMRDGFAALHGVVSRALPVVAYPYGLYDRTTLAAARSAGMTAGVTMEGRSPGRRPAPMTIPRVGIGEIHGPRSIAMRLAHALRPAVILRNRGIHPRMPRDPHVASDRPTPRSAR